ncbi:hypothetical protein BgAZ_304050 [Babesia gibsoni]|uniref:Uncharacterized protein n=1 Tax=Babesia gibsoni TaxID=33632 RepID=A0AAD8LR50_BABGI|nr:hypothetical protein BgAZ_304050 [Babesia gibsoni]
MHSLPVLTANSIIINEAPNSLKIDNEPTAGVPIKDAFYGFMYYKVDYKSFYELLKHHDQKDSKEHEAKNSIWKIILPPNMVINASSAHTMPFHEDMTVKLHGSIGSKNAFVLLFHMEAFKVIIEEKVKIAFRIRMDRLWHLRRRMHFNNIKSYLKSIVLRFKNRNFIYRRLKHYDFSWIKRKPNDPFPLIPFFNIVKDDFYKILDGTSLLKQEVTVGDIEDHTKDVAQHIHREVDVLVENINRFIVDGKCVMVEKTEPFYVAEVSIRSSIYTFYNAMSPKVCHKLWQKPARYMITAELKDAKHIRMVMAIVKMVFLTTIATVASFFALLSYLTHTKPWRI